MLLVVFYNVYDMSLEPRLSYVYLRCIVTYLGLPNATALSDGYKGCFLHSSNNHSVATGVPSNIEDP